MPAESSDLTRQYSSSLSILAVALFVGVPIWWKTTEVYRCPLPYQEIGELENKHVPPELAIKVSLSLLSETDNSVGPLITQLRKELVVGSISARSTRVSVRYIIQDHKLNSKEKTDLLSFLQSDTIKDFSSHVSEVLPSSLGHYSILLIPEQTLSHVQRSTATSGGEEDWSVLVSQYRHTLIRIKDMNDLLPCVADVLEVIKIYGDKRPLEKALKNSAGVNQDRVDVENMRQLRASQGYQLSFTLLNPDTSEGHASWNIEEATNDILVPFLNHPGIASLGNFTVSSQEFHYTDTKLRPKKDSGVFYVTSAQLPPMISSVESKLGSHVSQFPSLSFLVYVPRQKESPLFVRSPTDKLSLTDNFLVSQWGGVVIINPKNASSEEGTTQMIMVDMEKTMRVFIDQLKMLLGVPNTLPDREKKFQYSLGRYGITDWQVDQLLVGKLMESTSMASLSLVSLVQLLSKVKNMVISDHIQREVEYSLLSIQKCYSQASSGSLHDAYHSAKEGMKAAETAFFDPSILELLYFPDDQKFAIYIPLFLPISIPVLLSSVAAFKWLGAIIKSRQRTSERD